MSEPIYSTRDKPIKGTVVLRRQDDPPNGPWVTVAEFSGAGEAEKYIHAAQTIADLTRQRDTLVAACQSAERLLRKLGGHNHDPEYSELVAALATTGQ